MTILKGRVQTSWDKRRNVHSKGMKKTNFQPLALLVSEFSPQQSYFDRL